MTIASTHSVVNTKSAARRFGAGLTYFVPLAVVAEGFVEPSDEDNRWAAENLGPEPEPGISDMEARALEAAYHDSIEHLQPGPAGVCKSCGEYAESLEWGLCENCLDDAATDAAIACQNKRAMGQYRVF
jgi:hypothetical protein